MLQNTEDTRTSLVKADALPQFKRDLNDKTKDRLRMQTVSWLLENRKDIVNKITENQQIIISWLDYVGYIDQAEFDKLLMGCNIKYEKNLFERLFWLLDLNGNGVIEQREILIGLDMFKEYSFEEKLNVFF
eukprot:TRINITY_DN7715_c0_g1_i4.p1 TRINITY_DN7715_c0_g1~~TRINITY_DN7715_c0_g1_i4.p1  ORF type:complete len:131 (+),score=24.96 TRINITY_DN7715_c0_g1_i4:139-531(+)